MIIVTIGFIGAVFYVIWVIERNKVEILTLYSYLHLNEIREVYHASSKYMSNLNHGSLLKTVKLQNAIS